MSYSSYNLEFICKCNTFLLIIYILRENICQTLRIF
nr:MAG TPA: hypothetical protein [Caudoviricetes sp.]